MNFKLCGEAGLFLQLQLCCNYAFLKSQLNFTDVHKCCLLVGSSSQGKQMEAEKEKVNHPDSEGVKFEIRGHQKVKVTV